jgi:hypothetical protein
LDGIRHLPHRSTDAFYNVHAVNVKPVVHHMNSATQ